MVYSGSQAKRCNAPASGLHDNKSMRTQAGCMVTNLHDMEGVVVMFVSTRNAQPILGSAGLKTQLPGVITSVSSLNCAPGAVGCQMLLADVK